MVKKLLRSVREYKKASIQAPLLVAMECVMDVIIPLLMANLIDNGIDMGNMPYIIKIGIILILAAGISILFGVVSGRLASKAAAGFAKNLRKDMYYSIQNFSFANIDKFSTASIVTRLTTDVTNVHLAYQMILRLATRAPIMILFSLVVSFTLSPTLALVFLACIPVLGTILYIITTKSHPIFERVFDTYDLLNNTAQENLRGIRVVKSFVREDYENQKFDKISQSIYKDYSHAERIVALNMPVMQTCVYTCMVLISWLGARLIVSSGGTALTTGELMSLITYAMQILMSLMALSMVFVMITISRASSERIVEILEEQSTITSKEGAATEVPDGSIQFDHVNFTYSKTADKLCLDDINISIRSGETIGILGGTGSSKSSLVQLIPRLYDVTEGRVLVGGIDVRDYDIQALRSQVAVVLQKNELFSGTIKDNLRWGKEDATDEELVHACKLAQADEFIRSFPDGYDTYIEQGGTNVSGGQKQRLCIARALLMHPKILILDDSTSAVDTKTDALIRKAFLEEIPDTTKLIIAQRVASVQDADRIIIMDEGKIVACGNHEELLKTSQIYQEVYESQMKGAADDEE